MKVLCAECGSDEMQQMAWADINTGEVITWDENSDYWCENCQAISYPRQDAEKPHDVAP